MTIGRSLFLCLSISQHVSPARFRGLFLYTYFFSEAFDFRTYLNMNRSPSSVRLIQIVFGPRASLCLLYGALLISSESVNFILYCFYLYITKKKISRSINWNSWPFKYMRANLESGVCLHDYVDLGIVAGALLASTCYICKMGMYDL